MPLSFKFNRTWIAFNLMALWCLLAHEQFTILLFHPFASKAPTLPGVSPKYRAVGTPAPQGNLQKCSVWGVFVIFLPFRHTHYLGSAATAKGNCLCLTHPFPYCPSTMWEEEKPVLPHLLPTQFPLLLPIITQTLLCSPCPALSLPHSCHQYKIK